MPVPQEQAPGLPGEAADWILTSTRQKELDRQLEALGLGDSVREQVCRMAARAAVLAKGQRLDKLALGQGA